MHLRGVAEAPASEIVALQVLLINISYCLFYIRTIINILSLVPPPLALIKQFKLIPIIYNIGSGYSLDRYSRNHR
jgi:hypothetical protein